MDAPTAQTLLDELAQAGPRAWSVVSRIKENADSALIDEVQRRLRSGALAQTARPFIMLLGELKHLPQAAKVLREFLSLSQPDDVAATLRALGNQLGPEDGSLIEPLLHHPDATIRVAAIATAAYVGDVKLAEAIAPSIDAQSGEERKQAATTLGLLRATKFASRLVGRLAQERDLNLVAFLAALELLGDREVVPKLIEFLRMCDVRHVWDVAHALWVLTGVDPVVEDGGRGPEFNDRLRKGWLRAADAGQLSSPPPSRITDVQRRTPTLISFDVEFGRGRLCFDYDPPTPGSSWVRWGRSLYASGQRVYDVGSSCGTCELLLRLTSFPSGDLPVLAQRMETAAEPLSSNWLEALSPLFQQLRSGRYLAGLISLPLERIDREHARASWFNKRESFRPRDPDDDPDEAGPPWFSTEHFQGPRFEPNAFPVLMPTRDLNRLDEVRVSEFLQRIQSGERPSAVALGWLDQRHVQGGDWPERFLNLVILNGHHRLEAYSRAKVPAPIVVVARVADSWGPPQAPEQWLQGALEALAGGERVRK